jgi:hypothetical protein
MEQFSGSTGVPVSVLKVAKRAGCPAFISGSRIDSAVFLRWYFAQSSDAHDLPKGFTSWRAFREKIDALLKKSTLDRVEGDSMSVSEGKRQVAIAMGCVMNEQKRMEQELPPICSGLDPQGIHSELKKFHAESVAKWKAEFEKVGQPEQA